MIDLDILVVLDRSGSMQTGHADHEGGLQSFVRDQRSLEGDVRFTLVQFDSHNPCEIVFDRVPLDQVQEDKIRLIPRGGTPLHSAVGRSIAHLEEQQAKEPSDHTVVMIITDGQDTGSNGEWTKELVQSRVKALEAKGASVLYLGANVDAFSEAGGLGVVAAYAANYNVHAAGSTRAAYGTVSNKIANARVMGASAKRSGQHVNSGLRAAAMSFTAQDYQNIDQGTPVEFTGAVETTTVPTTTGAHPPDSNTFHTTSGLTKDTE